jgi:hypothetical protein
MNSVSKIWDAMQKDDMKINIKPSRLFAKYYVQKRNMLSNRISVQEDSSQDTILLSTSTNMSNRNNNTNKNNNNTSNNTTTTTTTNNNNNNKRKEIDRVDQSFEQRYIDQLGPLAMTQKYEDIAEQQKKRLWKETINLQKRFSAEIEESFRMEHTIMSISTLVSEFANFIEGQTSLVEEIADVAQETTNSVQSADQELLIIVERTQSQNWNMIILICSLSLLLLLLHFITP